MNITSTTARLITRCTAFFAAAVVTTVLVGSQFGLASRYEAQSGAVLAGQPASGLVALAETPAQTTGR
ncbi:MAG: hypothetical protein IV093_00970 [Rubrivivax sp.]|nr:hypothetical protein [Rubrivivax sp.]